jgi:ubiquitin C-terminal hydrolase
MLLFLANLLCFFYSCYANVVIQCLTFTRPLTAYLLEGLHSKNCNLMLNLYFLCYHTLLNYSTWLLHFVGSNKVWCFLCEFERLIMEGKRGQSPLSPTGILSHLSEIGSSFGPGEQEDAHEFLRWDFLFLIFLSWNYNTSPFYLSFTHAISDVCCCGWLGGGGVPILYLNILTKLLLLPFTQEILIFLWLK